MLKTLWSKLFPHLPTKDTAPAQQPRVIVYDGGQLEALFGAIDVLEATPPGQRTLGTYRLWRAFEAAVPTVAEGVWRFRAEPGMGRIKFTEVL